MGSGESQFIKDLSDVNQGFDEPECKKIFDTFDKGKTGYLSRDVAVKFLTKYAKVKKLSNPKQFAEDTFTRLDTNRDGKLAYNELLKRQASTAPIKTTEAKSTQSAPVPASSSSSAVSSTSAVASAAPSCSASSPSTAQPTPLGDIFSSMLKDSSEGDENVLLGDSLENLFTAVGVASDGIMTLGISWKFECKTMGEISRTEFIKGCEKAKCKSLDDIKRLVETTEKILKTDTHQFKQFYAWVFDFAKEGEDRKTLDAESACDMWGLVLVHHFSLLPKWLKFFQESKTATVTRDVWTQLAEFAFQVKGGLQNWQDDGSWPVLIDEFAQHCNSNH